MVLSVSVSVDKQKLFLLLPGSVEEPIPWLSLSEMDGRPAGFCPEDLVSSLEDVLSNPLSKVQIVFLLLVFWEVGGLGVSHMSPSFPKSLCSLVLRLTLAFLLVV